MGLTQQKKSCLALSDKITSLKSALLEAVIKKEQWEAEKEIEASFVRTELKNEQQRKAFILDQKFKPGSPWKEMFVQVENLKMELQQVMREYRIEIIVFSANCKGVLDSELPEEDSSFGF
jgi:hypothetical protein